MMLMRRPLRLYDVDIIGLAVMVALGVAAWQIGVTPYLAGAAEAARVREELAQAEQKVRAARHRLDATRAQADELAAEVAGRLKLVPSAAQRSQVTAQVVSLARGAGLEPTSITPAEPHAAEGYVFADVTIQARGTMPQYLAFVQGCARDIPYHSIEDFSIVRERGREEDCLISVTIRLYLIPGGTS